MIRSNRDSETQLIWDGIASSPLPPEIQKPVQVLVGEALDEEALGFYVSRELGFERLARPPSRRIGVGIDTSST